MRKQNPGNFDWTPAAIARLTELWLCGNSGGEIGRRMGLSRSGVMGKLRRLDLLCRDRPRMPVVRLARRASPVPKPAPQKPPHKRHLRRVTDFVIPLPPIGSFDLLDLRHNSCRWPEGDRAPYTFCGAGQAPNSSYCSEHTQRSMSGTARGVPFYLAKQALG